MIICNFRSCIVLWNLKWSQSCYLTTHNDHSYKTYTHRLSIGNRTINNLNKSLLLWGLYSNGKEIRGPDRRDSDPVLQSRRKLLQGVPPNPDVGRRWCVDGRGEVRLSGEEAGHAENKSSKDMAVFENWKEFSPTDLDFKVGTGKRQMRTY